MNKFGLNIADEFEKRAKFLKEQNAQLRMELLREKSKWKMKLNRTNRRHEAEKRLLKKKLLAMQGSKFTEKMLKKLLSKMYSTAQVSQFF